MNVDMDILGWVLGVVLFCLLLIAMLWYLEPSKPEPDDAQQASYSNLVRDCDNKVGDMRTALATSHGLCAAQAADAYEPFEVMGHTAPPGEYEEFVLEAFNVNGQLAIKLDLYTCAYLTKHQAMAFFDLTPR